MGVIWLCGVRPAGYTRTLIFYVLTIHFFTPAEQLQLRKVYAGDTGLSIPSPKKAWKIQGLEGPRSTMAYEAPCGLH